MAQLSSIPVEDVFDRLIDVALVNEVVARHNGLFGNGERLILVEGKAVSDVHGEIAFIIEFEALSGAYASATSNIFGIFSLHSALRTDSDRRKFLLQKLQRR